MAEEFKPRLEPKLLAEGYSESEILDWMKGKVSAVSKLETALADRDMKQQALERLDAEIERLANLAALEMVRGE